MVKIRSKIFIVLLILSFSNLAYTENSKQEWQTIDAEGNFTFKIPPDMKEVFYPGIDSYIGKYENSTVTLTFDYGWWSDNLNYSHKPVYKEKNIEIDGKKAKFVTFYNEGSSYEYLYVIAAYFSDLGIKNEKFGKTKLTMWANCKSISDYAIVERIIKSIQFPEN